MSRILKKYVLSVILLFLFVMDFSLRAQISEWIYQRDYRIEPTEKGKLFFELDNLSFFKDNEYEGNYQKGYTLPGVWIQPKFVFFPLSNIKLELGANFLYYWGAKDYPNLTYMGIPMWEEGSTKARHIRPFLRFQVFLYDHLNVVLGNIYGGANHRLSDPLYNPEYNLSADPETGLQLLLDYTHVTVDGWVNWQNFIFKGEKAQEVFMAGVSSKIRFTDTSSRFQASLPLQAVFRHQGGEIDSLDAGIQTWVNAATGIELSYRLTKDGFFKKIGFEALASFSSQQAGKVLPVNKGWGINTVLSLDMKDFRLRAGYWKCDDFFTIAGNPFFSSVSSIENNKTFDKPSMVYGSLEYVKQLGKSYAIGADISIFHHFKTTSRKTISDENGIGVQALVEPESAATSLAVGIYLRINPSILIKSFK